ncbi:MAG: component of SufBCD complex [Pararhodobacter sp.]|nr:component of SufBCD complex [Pararhodobacter sp.]
MDWYNSVFTLIDMRSFSNLWFWIVLAVMWSSVSHYILGVPFDMVVRARRQGGEAMHDLEALVAIQTRRRLHLLHASGIWITLFMATLLSALVVMGFGYGIEFAQALAFLGIPATLVFALGFRLALRLEREEPQGEGLTRLLTWHRFTIQCIGLLSVLFTALWGMWHNLSLSVLSR